MKIAKKVLAMLLATVMVLAMTLTSFAAGEEGTEGTEDKTGSITMNNATIDESYHIYKLFDVTFGESYQDKDGNTVIPTAYVATPEQVEALEAAEGNVFAFKELSDGKYQVTVGTKEVDGEQVPYTEEEVIAFLQGFVRTLSGGVFACSFPGAVEVTGAVEGADKNEGIDSNKVATASTIVWKGIPYGYYFVTSSLGATVTIDTSNPDAAITDKNEGGPNWNNEPDEPNPDKPVKDVLNQESNQSIDGNQVKVGDTLTYSISYTNDSGVTIDDLVITDAPPVGTGYVEGSAKAYRYVNGEIDLSSEDTNAEIEDTNTDNITWTFHDVADGTTVEVRFQVNVTEAALNIISKTIENDALVDVKIGDNTYNLKTNQVKNPVYDPDDPVKDVLRDGESIDGEPVNAPKAGTEGTDPTEGDILTYQIKYTNNSGDVLESVTITDAAPTGTVYVAGETTKGTRKVSTEGDTETPDENVEIAVAADGTITWTFVKVAAGETVYAYFNVKVTEEALTITDKTIVNDATVTIPDHDPMITNKVKNPVDKGSEDTNPGKVIVNADGSETTTSTGKFGDTVTFDIGVNAVNQVTQEVTGDEGGNKTSQIVQVEKYYLYDKMDAGFDLKPETMVITINGNDYQVAENISGAKDEGVTLYNVQDNEGNVFGTLFTKKVAAVDPERGYTLIEATIPWVDGGGNALYPNCKLHLRYDAVINTDAVIAGGGNPNSVYYDYKTTLDTDNEKPDPEHPKYPDGTDLNHESKEKTTTTYTYALGLQKISAETGAPLEGAEFTAVDAGGNPIYAVPVKDNEGNEVAGQYNYTSENTAVGRTNSFVTNADGQIIIKGVDIGGYEFTETKAPVGYNLLTKPVSVTAEMDSSSTTHTSIEWTVTRSFKAITREEFDAYTDDMYIKEGDTFTLVENKPESWSDTETYYRLVGSDSTDEGVVSGPTTTITFPVSVTILKVENSAGSLMPSTGGIGTTIFYILGAILVAGAGILLVVRRRMSMGK